MDIRQLRNFVVLAETLNYRRAAELLHITQPPLSSSIRKLEEQLGTALFARSRRGTVLTEAGAAALDDARRALQHINQFCRAAQAVDKGHAGVLRVAFVGSATYALLPRVIPEFKRHCPGVQLQLQDSTTRQILGMVERNDVDVGLVRTPVTADGAVTLTRIENDVFVAAVPADSALARKRRLMMNDLAEQAFIFYSRDVAAGLHDMAMLACRNAGFVPHVRQHAERVQTVISLVQSGLGVALVPSAAARQAIANVVFKPLHDSVESAPIGLAAVTLTGKETPAARRFLDILCSG
jgi:DNA-binding transcriptional LysR family regulator